MNLKNHYFEFTSTETSVCATLLYTANHLSHKRRSDLKIYKRRKCNLHLLKLSTREDQILLWESITDYDRSMDLIDFNCNYFKKILDNIPKEQKWFFLLRDFTVNLLNYNEHI